jgi:hypothetical protein
VNGANVASVFIHLLLAELIATRDDGVYGKRGYFVEFFVTEQKRTQ